MPPGFLRLCNVYREGHLQLKGLLQHIVSGVLVLTAHQQRNIQIAGGDEQNLDVSHGQCVQSPGSYTAAGDHVLTKEVQLGVTNADQRGSLGMLVEIGGSFRIPDVMAASGAKLVEVGATNRTHLTDYEQAITPDTAMILKVHPSNYRIEGFHEEVGSRELAALAHKHGLLFYEDQGSGALLPDDILVRGGEETTPASVSAGLDIVSCSGDKLLGAAQAGIIMGRRDLVQACGSHPLMRALRPGKLALAALEATLRIYMDGADVAHREVPVLNMLTLPQAHLERRARKLRELMVAGFDKAGCPCAVQVEIVEESSTPGGGSLPTVELPTMCVAVRLVDERLSVDALKRSLVQDFDTPVVTRTSHDRILFDVRTLVGDRDIETAASTLVACVKKAIAR